MKVPTMKPRVIPKTYHWHVVRLADGKLLAAATSRKAALQTAQCIATGQSAGYVGIRDARRKS